VVGVLQDDDESFVLIGYLLSDRDLVFSQPLGVQRMLGRGSSTHPMPNTSSVCISGCSRIDRFGGHFVANVVQEGHVKAPVTFPLCNGNEASTEKPVHCTHRPL